MLLNSWDTVIQLWQAADTRYWALLPAAREWRKGIKPVTGTEFWDKILISVMHAYTKMHTAGFKRLPRSLIKFYITPDIVEELPKLHFPKTRERTFKESIYVATDLLTPKHSGCMGHPSSWLPAALRPHSHWYCQSQDSAWHTICEIQLAEWDGHTPSSPCYVAY